MRRKKFFSLASASATAVATMGVTAAATAAPGVASAVTLSANWYASAPYVMPTGNNPPNLATVMDATGEKAFLLAFILANGSSCSPAWDGTSPVSSDTTVASVIDTVRSKGGDVDVAIGGYGGTKLGQVCSDTTFTANAYQQVISKYGLKAMDVDLEEPEYENLTAVNNELGAMKILQRNNPGIYLSVTVPGTTSDTGYFGENILKTIKSLGFLPNAFTIMPFDGGFNGAASQQAALNSFHMLIMNDVGLDSATAWSHEGHLPDERPQRHRRILLPKRLPVEPQLRALIR